MGFTKVGGVYKYRSKLDFLSSLSKVDGEKLTLDTSSELAKKVPNLAVSDFEKYEHFDIDPDYHIYQMSKLRREYSFHSVYTELIYFRKMPVKKSHLVKNMNKIHRKEYDMFGNIVIEINRDSVCMGDDCESHKMSIEIKQNTKMSELFIILQEYVPAMNNVVWAISSSDGIQGYIITDSNAKSKIEVYGGDTQVVKRLSKNEVICKYYYPSKFSWIDGNTGKRINQYVECSTFLQKVKKDNE